MAMSSQRLSRIFSTSLPSWTIPASPKPTRMEQIVLRLASCSWKTVSSAGQPQWGQAVARRWTFSPQPGQGTRGSIMRRLQGSLAVVFERAAESGGDLLDHIIGRIPLVPLELTDSRLIHTHLRTKLGLVQTHCRPPLFHLLTVHVLSVGSREGIHEPQC